jgi:PPK2 family polyphosphate:nucleotide phosphotransferase
MKIDYDSFRVREGEAADLDRRPTRIAPLCDSKQEYREALQKQVERLSDLQQLFYAANSHAVLLIFQAMDVAGKDGTIRHVMSGVNPQGCRVYSFKHPSAQELQHDFLWRTTRDLPERGMIGIFNRSYYEDVLIVRVHPEILHSESLPDRGEARKALWRERYRSINDLERHLHDNGTRILKFYLHLSKEEQAKRFVDRIDDETKNWKFSSADMEERKFWKDYRVAYEKCLTETSTDDAPWYAVPADEKESCRLIVSRIIVDALEGLGMSYPKPTKERRAELQAIREKLQS